MSIWVPMVLSSVVLMTAFLSGGLSPREGPFIVEFELVDLSGDEDGRIADPGGHCSSAWMDGERLTLGLRSDEKRGEGPWVAVFPQMPEHWQMSLGASPYKMGFPATIGPGVQDDPASFGDLEWVVRDGNALILLDGKPVSLPHSWEVMGQDGTWKVKATLYEWDGPVKFQRLGLCM